MSDGRVGGGRVRFVILCLGRSGSTHLQSLLDSHRKVRCFGELFSDRVPAGSEGFVHALETDVSAYLRRLSASVDEPVVGFKLPMGSIRVTPGAAAAVREDRDLRVIRLSRRNLLAQLVSRRLQAATRVSHSIQGDYGDATVRLDPGQTLRAFEHMEADERELDRLAAHHPSARIFYEELGDERRLDEVQRFLGVEPEPLRSWFEKVRRAPLSQAVENWEELAAALRGTRYEPLLSAPA